MHAPTGHVARIRENLLCGLFCLYIAMVCLQIFSTAKISRPMVINECIVAYSLPTSLELSTLVKGVWTLGRIYDG